MRDTKPGHHFIKDQQRPVGRSQIAQAFEIACRERHAAHVAGNRLNDDAGDFMAALGKRRRERSFIVIRDHQGMTRKVGRDACTVRRAEGRKP